MKRWRRNHKNHSGATHTRLKKKNQNELNDVMIVGGYRLHTSCQMEIVFYIHTNTLSMATVSLFITNTKAIIILHRLFLIFSFYSVVHCIFLLKEETITLTHIIFSCVNTFGSSGICVVHNNCLFSVFFFIFTVRRYASICGNMEQQQKNEEKKNANNSHNHRKYMYV